MLLLILAKAVEPSKIERALERFGARFALLADAQQDQRARVMRSNLERKQCREQESQNTK